VGRSLRGQSASKGVPATQEQKKRREGSFREGKKDLKGARWEKPGNQGTDTAESKQLVATLREKLGTPRNGDKGSGDGVCKKEGCVEPGPKD